MELWKDIDGYEGLYQVSNYGNIKSLNRINNYGKTVHEKILTNTNSTSGYLQVNLSKNGKARMFQVHRLVALAFIPNPDNKPQIDHIDNNKHNNYTSNLRWVTEKENMNNLITKNTLSNISRKPPTEKHKMNIAKSMMGRKFSNETREKLRRINMGKTKSKESILKRVEKCKKTVICLNDNKIFDSIKAASLHYNIDQSGIIRVCKGTQKTVNSLRFKYYIDNII